MTKQNIKNAAISIAAIIVLFGGLIWLSRGGTQNDGANISQSGGGALLAEETNFNFGEVSMVKGKVSYTYKLKNDSNEPATISKIYTSCMCTEATLVHGGKKHGPYGMPGHGFIPKINESISAGETADIEVVFDPAAHGPAGVGLVERVVYVEDGRGKQLQLKFTVTVTP